MKPTSSAASSDVTVTPSRTGALNEPRPALEVTDDLVLAQEPIRVVAGVCAAREPDRRVRRHEAEALPTVTPRLRDPPTVEHDMLDAELGELVTHGQPSLPSADDEHVHRLGHRAIDASSTARPSQRTADR